MYDLVLLQPPDTVSANPKMYFPLGMVHLAAVVREAGYRVAVMDCRTGMVPLPTSRFYGFSCTTPQIDAAVNIARTLKGKTIAGGPHASMMPHAVKQHFDYVVAGEGEEAILDILSGKAAEGVIQAPRIRDLNRFPIPAWDLVHHPFSRTLFPGERYGKGPMAATTIFSRGCPARCAFCANLFRTPVIYRGLESVTREMHHLRSLGISHFRIEDDNLTLHPEFEAICNMLHDLKVVFKGHTRSDHVTQERMRLLKWAGCEELGLGVESADDDVLMINRKRETADLHRKSCHEIRRAGLRVKTYFMTGLPGETLTTILLNKRFMSEVKPDKWTLSRFTPYPGCEIYNNPDAFGVKVVNTDLSQYWNFPRSSVVELESADRTELDRRYKELYSFMVNEEWRK